MAIANLVEAVYRSVSLEYAVKFVTMCGSMVRRFRWFLPQIEPESLLQCMSFVIPARLGFIPPKHTTFIVSSILMKASVFQVLKSSHAWGGFFRLVMCCVLCSALFHALLALCTKITTLLSTGHTVSGYWMYFFYFANFSQAWLYFFAKKKFPTCHLIALQYFTRQYFYNPFPIDSTIRSVLASLWLLYFNVIMASVHQLVFNIAWMIDDFYWQNSNIAFIKPDFSQITIAYKWTLSRSN